jgi:hypothetical protein
LRASSVCNHSLRASERDGYVTRKVYPTVPPKVEYALREPEGTGAVRRAFQNLDDRMSPATKTPKIARVWRGRTRRERADEYERYNYNVGIRPLIEKALAVQTFREDRESETEFVTVSYWENVEAMAAFTGGDPTKIHHLPRDPEFLIELPQSVQILEIRSAHGLWGDADVNL